MLEKINYNLIEGIEELSNQILAREEKIGIIIGFIKRLNRQDRVERYLENANLLKESNRVYNSIKNELDSLELLRDKAKEINRKIAVLLAWIQSKESTETHYAAQIENIKQQMGIYNTENEKAKKVESMNNIEINNLFNNPIFKEYFKEEYPNFVSKVTQVDNKKPTAEAGEEKNSKDNGVLIISEKKRKVYLPYKYKVLQAYITKYPKQYKSEEDVIQKEFIHPIDSYMRFPSVERFKQAYSLIRDKEAKPFIEALKYGLDMMFKAKLNPAIIAACSSQEELERYLHCLEKNKLSEFKDFEIRFEINPV